MSEYHLAYLNLGSNIEPEANLPKAVKMLSEFGEIKQVSNVWESEAVGANGPNYLNVCVLFQSRFTLEELKEKVVDRIESALGRERSENKFADRTIDVDIVLFDGISLSNDHWSLPFIVVTLAEIHPTFKLPVNGESIIETATRLRQNIWMEARRGILS